MITLHQAIDVLPKDGTIGKENNLFVTRDENGHVHGIGPSYVACIINTARRILGLKQAYDMRCWK